MIDHLGPPVACGSSETTTGLRQPRSYGLGQLPDFRVAPGQLLRKRQVLVDRNLERTPIAGNEFNSAEMVSENLEQLLRRPRGACRVVSRDAVDN